MTRPTIYLHIGFHKTGTTAIQNFLAANVDKLAKQDCLIPTTGRAGSTHAHLANSLKRVSINADADALYAKLAKEIAKARKSKVIISSECFMEEIPPQKIKKQFDDVDADIKIVVYVRRQDSWLQSLYNEVVRDPSRRYTGDIMHMREVRNDVADYSSVLRKWERAFGQHNIVVRVFELEQMPNGLFADFMSAVGLSIDEDFVIPDSKTGGNAGFPDVLVLALRSLNQVPMKRPMYRRLVEALTTMSRDIAADKQVGGYALITPQEQRLLVERHAEGNARIAVELLGRADGRLFCAPVPVGDCGSRAEGPTVKMQRWIFERLPDDIQKHFERMRSTFTMRNTDEPFFPKYIKNEEKRLRAVIQRQRTELNWLYEEEHHRGR